MQMKKIVQFIIAAALVLTGQAATAADFYVAPKGNDANPGSQAQPFATLGRARQEIRNLKKAGALNEAVTVNVRAGTYGMPDGMKLEPQDSGTETAPVTWRAYQNEKVVFIGGRVITGFTPYQGKILKADLSAQGFKGVNFRQLIFGGQRQILARFPDFDPQNPYGGGFTYADGKRRSESDETGLTRNDFTCKPGDLRTWAKPGEAEVFIFPGPNYWNNICRIESIDRATRHITLAQSASYPIHPGNRYYFQNALEELDAPGEWYLDRQTSTLYFWPPQPLNGKLIVAPTTRSILELGPGTAFVTFRGFTLECCEGTAVVMNKSSNCLVAGCTIQNVGGFGGSGAAINGGTKNGIAGCDIYNTGSNGISLSGGDRKKLIAAENYADNNYIHHIGVYNKNGIGVEMTGVGNRVAHNLIHDTPRMGIMFAGNNLIMEYNHIRHVNLETQDTGAIYTGGRDWISSRGSVIRYNYFHDILGYGLKDGKWVSPHYVWGVYLDDNAGGVDVIGNVVARAQRGPIHLHNGRDNHVENNIFIDGGQQQIQLSGWTGTHPYWTKHRPTMITGYESVVNEPAWKGMRNMNIHPLNAVLPDNTIMAGNEFLRNIVYYHNPESKYVMQRNFNFEHNPFDYNLIWHFGHPVLTGVKKSGKAPDDFAAWQAAGEDTHSVVADPMFMDPDKDDYRLKPDSPAIKLGFKPSRWTRSDPTRTSFGQAGRSWKPKAPARNHW